MVINVCVTPYKNETIYGLINRFNKMVESEGVLKDYKISSMRKNDRVKFKKFTNERRIEKVRKRVESILNV